MQKVDELSIEDPDEKGTKSIEIIGINDIGLNGKSVNKDARKDQ